MSEVVHVNDYEVALLANDSLVMLGNALAPKPRPVKDKDDKDNSLIEEWGDDNNYPQWVLEQISDVTLVEPILDWKARALYGGGLAYGKLVTDNGEERFERIVASEIEEWAEATDLDTYLRTASINFYTFYNIFPELSQNAKGAIKYLACKDTADCRYGKKKNSGIIKELYVSPDWEAYDAKDKKTEKYEIFNHFYTDLENLKAKGKHQFVYPVANPSPGRAYYQKAPWHVILKTWLPIARAVPEFKKALLKNQLTLKYIIKVPEWWWTWKYKDWESKSEKERLKLVQQEKSDFEKFFKGDRQGNSMMYTQRDDTHSKKYSDWEVVVVDDKMKTGMYIEDSQEADAHIFKNLGVDSTLFGNGTGKDRSGAGSGSDKRVAWNNYMIMTKPHQDLILKPLQFIAKYNGWQEQYAPAENEKLVFWFKNYQIAKLDSGRETAENNSQTPTS